MKWDIAIKGVDFGSLIPHQMELKPHDHPLEMWASDCITSLFQDLKVELLAKKTDAVADTTLTPLVRQALVDAYDRQIKLVDQLVHNVTVTSAVK